MFPSTINNLFKKPFAFLPLISLFWLNPLRLMATSATYSAGTHSVAYVTAPSEDVAKKLAHGIVKNKLAACVNVIPKITSIYEWKNEINEDSEVLMMIKTRTEIVDSLTEYVKANHPYEVCEVISLPIENGNPAYLSWLSDVVPKKTET